LTEKHKRGDFFQVHVMETDWLHHMPTIPALLDVLTGRRGWAKPTPISICPPKTPWLPGRPELSTYKERTQPC
jgi:hypothetical protein